MGSEIWPKKMSADRKAVQNTFQFSSVCPHLHGTDLTEAFSCIALFHGF